MMTNLPVTPVEIPFPKSRRIITHTDLEGIITYVNNVFVGVCGFTRDELIGKNHNVVRHPDMLPEAFDWLWRSIKEGRTWRGVVKIRCKNGNFCWTDAVIKPIIKNNEVIGYKSVRTEPTRQQVADAELLYKQLKETYPDSKDLPLDAGTSQSKKQGSV